MNLSELADLANVINQLKLVLNTYSSIKIPKDTAVALKKRLSLLEEQFVKEVIEPGLVLDFVQERAATSAFAAPAPVVESLCVVTTVESGAVMVQSKQDVVEPASSVTKTLVEADNGVMMVSAPALQAEPAKEDLSGTLSEPVFEPSAERPKIAVKGKRKAK